MVPRLRQLKSAVRRNHVCVHTKYNISECGSQSVRCQECTGLIPHRKHGSGTRWTIMPTDKIPYSTGIKKQATALLQQARDTMPKSTALMPQVRTASAAAANISDGYIHSVYDDGSPVKPKMKRVTESVQFKRWFGNWIENPEKASKTCL